MPDGLEWTVADSTLLTPAHGIFFANRAGTTAISFHSPDGEWNDTCFVTVDHPEVENAFPADADIAPAALYDLDGRRIAQPRPGTPYIYVRAGSAEKRIAK